MLPTDIKFENAAGEALAELIPSPKLADLVKRSRELTAGATDVGDE
jgi:CRISPR-associated protein Csb1